MYMVSKFEFQKEKPAQYLLLTQLHIQKLSSFAFSKNQIL